MKKYLIILNLLLTVVAIAQNNDAQYRADHVGQELSKEEIQKLFEKEQDLLEAAKDLEGKISIIPNNKFEEVFGVKTKHSNRIVIDGFLGKRYYYVKTAVDEFSSQEFKKYYSSLNEKNKRSLLTYNNLDQNCKAVSENRDLQKYLLSEYDRIKKIDNKKNRVQIKKIDFIQKFDFPGARDSILSLFTNTLSTDYSHQHEDLMLFILKNDELEAWNCYESIVDELLLFKKKNPELNDFYVPFSNKKLYISFLYSKDQFVKNSFINHSLEIINKGTINLHKISSLIGCLWNSGKLNNAQTELLVKALGNYNSDDAKKILQEYKMCLRGVNILDDLSESFIQDSLSLELFYPWVAFGLSSDESSKLMSFIEVNKEHLKRNTSCYRCSFGYISRRINPLAKKNTIDSLFHILDPKFKVDSITLFKDYYDRYLYGAGTIERPIRINVLTNFLLEEKFEVNQFDTEAGMIPLNYDVLLAEFGNKMQTAIGDQLQINQINLNYNREKDNYNELIYSIALGTKSSKIYRVELPNSGDWYSLSSIITVLNLILQDYGSDKRWVSADTGDQTSKYILMSPNDFNILKPIIRFIDMQSY